MFFFEWRQIVIGCAIEQYEHCCSIIALQFYTAKWQCAGLDPRIEQHEVCIGLLIFSGFFKSLFITHVVVILRPNKTTIAEKYRICVQIQVLYRTELVA